MSSHTNYPMADPADLETITTALTQDILEKFCPSWYTEDWVNFSTQNGKRLTFRFDRQNYIATLIGSKEETHYFGASHVPESKNMGAELTKTYPGLQVREHADANDIAAATERVLKNKRVVDVSVIRGDGNTPDYVKVGVEDGSFGVVAFKPHTLIAIEHSDGSERKVFGVEGRNVEHKRLNLAVSVMSGEDVIYTEPMTSPVYTLPEF